jgi:pimeloyl-ACP methyl ester carboxylesterase
VVRLHGAVHRNGNVSLHTIRGCGHAPALMAHDQIDIIARFMSGDDA